MNIATTRALFDELAKFIDFPPNVVKATIHFGVDEAVTVDVTYHANLKTPAEPTTKRFMLEEIHKPGLSTAHPSALP